MDEHVHVHQHLGSLLRHVPAVLFVLDNVGIIHICEGQPLQHVLPATTALIGRSVFDIAHELVGDHTESIAYMQAALAGETFTAVVDMNGRILQTRYEPLRSACGAVCGVWHRARHHRAGRA